MLLGEVALKRSRFIPLTRTTEILRQSARVDRQPSAHCRDCEALANAKTFQVRTTLLLCATHPQATADRVIGPGMS